MKANIDTVIVGPRVVLVPYMKEHVPKYHEWMLDDDLRALTASEPLSLDEEYEMQAKWQNDDDKLTFIVLSRELSTVTLHDDETVLPGDARVAQLPMIGDVNIFLYGTLDQLRQPRSIGTGEDEDEDAYAEVEIMIAEPAFRRRGLALETLQLMLGYATSQPQAFRAAPSSTGFTQKDALPDLEPLSHKYTFSPTSCPLQILPERLVTRISDTNVPSIRLFERLGFDITKRVEVFGEVEMKYQRPA